jgi:hypothetical protein
MSRKDSKPQDSYPGFTALDGVIERDFDPDKLGDILASAEECMKCSEEYDSAPCYPCPSYDGDLEALAETLEEDRLKRGVPLEVPAR